MSPTPEETRKFLERLSRETGKPIFQLEAQPGSSEMKVTKIIDAPQPTYGDLYSFLAARACVGDLSATEKFCRQHNIDFKGLRQVLEKHGAYCDCEVLWNVRERLAADKPISEVLP